jgi:hypothetical protein
MKRDQSRIIWGGLLILAGIFFALQEFNVLGNAIDYIWMIILAAGSGVFLWVYFTKQEQWWAIIPGLTLLGLAFTAFSSTLNILPDGNFTGAVFLGCVGLAFWLVYLRQITQWWAIIPGGVLLTLALVTVVGDLFAATQVFFFLGLAVTFLMVAVLPNQGQDTRWAFIPAAILSVMGIATFAPFRTMMMIIWPAALIVLGIYLIFKNWQN